MAILKNWTQSRRSAAERQVSRAVLVDDFLGDLSITVEPFDLAAATAARDAYFRFGKGFHPAHLNLADCFAYALARSRNDTLLFKGDDFARTDILPAWRP
jgi:ribonuclease VapC